MLRIRSLISRPCGKLHLLNYTKSHIYSRGAHTPPMPSKQKSQFITFAERTVNIDFINSFRKQPTSWGCTIFMYTNDGESYNEGFTSEKDADERIRKLTGQ